MTPHNDGGPAFPLGQYAEINGVPFTQPTNGMSLRDYFASVALKAIIAAEYDLSFDDAARDAYYYAEAMLDRRAGCKEAQP